MSDKGIIFSAPMVRALLAGRKTQTRRLIPEPFDSDYSVGWFHPSIIRCGEEVPGPRTFGMSALDGCWTWRLPYAPGDRLYVREAYRADSQIDSVKARDFSKGEPILYEADGIVLTAGCAMIEAGKLRPSIFLPRWASRLWLNVTDVRVQRLQEISEADAEAEGVDLERYVSVSDSAGAHVCGSAEPTDSIEEFRLLWNSLHDKPHERWDDNPWVCCVSFSVNHGNIDMSIPRAFPSCAPCWRK